MYTDYVIFSAFSVQKVLLTIMLPCLNESKTLPFVMENIREGLAMLPAETTHEILVVDNNSTDQTAQIAQNLGARVVHESQKGYGAAVRKGLLEAKGQYIIFADADGSYDFRYISVFLDALKDGAQFVTGSRFTSDMEQGAMPWLHRYVGTPLLTLLLNTVHGSDFLECNCGLRALRSDLVSKLGLRASGMEIASEMLINVKKLGIPYRQIPIRFLADKRGTPSHLRTFRDGMRHARLILLSKIS